MEREVLGLDPLCDGGEDVPAVNARERARLRNGRVNAFGTVHQKQECVRGDVRKVDRQHEAEIRCGRSQPGSETDHCRPDVAPVVHDGKGKGELVDGLADDDHTLAGRVEDSVCTLGQGFAGEDSERFRGSEAPAATANKEDPCYAVTRQGSE